MIIDLAKRFAKQGYYVFPTFLNSSGDMMKPYGWALNVVADEVKKKKAIPATTLEMDIDQWESKLKEHYRREIESYGILGRDCFIFDIDDKHGKNGSLNFEALRKAFDIPKCNLIVRTKSGGFHLYFKKPEKLKNAHVKSLASIIVQGEKYDGVDIRGNGGFVQGPTRIGDWVPGTYTLVKGEIEDELSEIPEKLLMHFLAASMSGDTDAMIASSLNMSKPTDTLSVLRRGELPEVVEEGNRNEAFFVFINALKFKGIDRATAKILCQQLAERCEGQETLSQSVDIDMMLDRSYEQANSNPYNVGLDLVQRGLCMLTGGGKPKYILLNDNPYMLSKAPHDLAAMKEILSRYADYVTAPDGKNKLVNPMDIAIRKIPQNQQADTLGFKAVNETIFQMSDDNGTRFLNTYQAPYIPSMAPKSNAFLEFKALMTRIFGPEGSDAYNVGMDYVAWYFQNPSIKPVISLYLISENRGVGKSLFLNLLTRLLGVNKLGERQARIRKLTDLTKRFFNPTGCLLNIVDEVQFSVHKGTRQETSDFWRELKNLITAETIEIEYKGGGSFNVLNTAGLILAGNKGSRFPIEEYDRRLWIIDNDAPILQRGVCDSLFNIVLDKSSQQERIDSINNIRWHLQHYKIQNDLNSIRAPMTAVKEQMYRATMTDEEEWLMDFFADESNLMAQVPIISKSAFMFLMEQCEDVPNERWRENAAHILREAIRRGQIKTVNYPSGQPIRYTDAPKVSMTGEILESGKTETLYITREFDAMKYKSREEYLRLYKINLTSIARWRTERLNKKKSVSLSDLSELQVVK